VQLQDIAASHLDSIMLFKKMNENGISSQQLHAVAAISHRQAPPDATRICGRGEAASANPNLNKYLSQGSHP
jgi:hypothetical protein